jgi:ubiquitin carboxyl-terminal hydrolase 8
MSSDAATLPSPPNIPPWKDSRPYSVGDTMHSSQVSRQVYTNGTSIPRRPQFPNIKDLQDQAASLNVNDGTPVCALMVPRRGKACIY